MAQPSTPPTSPSASPPEAYAAPAGGWGALFSSAKHVMRQGAPLRTSLALLKVNQASGFDCPGCAWPEPKPGVRSSFEFCENGAKAVAWETTSHRADPAFFASNPVAGLRGQTDHWLESQGRLTHPMRYDRASDRYVPIAWDEAFRLIAQALRGLASPNQAAFYTSGRTSNEAAFLYQLMGRMYGTNNFPDCANMCHESSGVAMAQTLGAGKGTVTLEDFEHADAIFVIGQNPGTNHPRMLTELEKASLRGAKIVAINPLRERAMGQFIHPQHAVDMMLLRSTSIASHHLQPLIGGDLAVLKGLAKLCIESDAAARAAGKPALLDHAFIAAHTTGYEAFAADALATPWPEIEAASGLTQRDLEPIADVYLKSERTIACWAMGLTQNKHAVATIQYVVNLLLFKGNIGKPGAGACPVRGHSNVQGDRTMGITAHPKPAFLDSLKRVFNFDPPRESGMDTVAAIEAMDAGQCKVFVALGGNFLAATPDTAHVALALEKCELLVHINTKLNRTHTAPGRECLLLPCLGRTELDVQPAGPQCVSVEDSMSMVHRSQGAAAPASQDLRSEPAIVASLAHALLGSDKVDWLALGADYRLIRDKIAATLPELFHDYNQRLEQPGGFEIRNPARDRRWPTASGKAGFTTHAIPDLTLPPGQLRLMTIRSHDQFNTTVYGLDDRYRGVKGKRRILFIHPADLAERGLRSGERLDITSHCPEDGLIRVARDFEALAYDIPRGCVAGYFPELNPLISAKSHALGSRTPLSKFVPVTVKRAV